MENVFYPLENRSAFPRNHPLNCQSEQFRADTISSRRVHSNMKTLLADPTTRGCKMKIPKREKSEC
jgi:hypothetical protein